MTNVFLAIMALIFGAIQLAAESGGQPLFYAVDNDHYLLWKSATASTVDLIERRGNKWTLSPSGVSEKEWLARLRALGVSGGGDEQVWEAAIKRLVAPVSGPEWAREQAVDIQVFGVILDKDRIFFSIISPKTAELFFLTRGSEGKWTKTDRLSIDQILNVFHDDFGDQAGTRALLGNAPTNKEDWAKGWNDFAKQVISMTTPIAKVYDDIGGKKRWILIEKLSQLEFDARIMRRPSLESRVQVAMIAAARDHPPAGGTGGSDDTGHLGRTVLLFTVSVGLGIGIVVGVALLWRNVVLRGWFHRDGLGVGREGSRRPEVSKFSPGPEMAEEVWSRVKPVLVRSLEAVLYHRLADVSAGGPALLPEDSTTPADCVEILAAVTKLRQAANHLRSSGSTLIEGADSLSTPVIFLARLERLLPEIDSRINQLVRDRQTAREELADWRERRGRQESELADLRVKCARIEELSTLLESARSDLRKALGEVERLQADDERRGRQESELADLRVKCARIEELSTLLESARSDLRKVQEEMEGFRREKEVCSRELVGQRSEALQLNQDCQRLRQELEKVTADKARGEGAGVEIGRLRSSFIKFRCLAERLQEGQKNYFSGRNEVQSAAMISFLANHSLGWFALGLVEDNRATCNAMLGNLDRICQVLRGFRGFEMAGKYLRAEFGAPSTPEETLIMPGSERGEATMFQYTLRFLRDSQRLDFGEYFFFVDEEGRLYRAA